MVCTVKNRRTNRLYFLKDLSFWLLLATNLIIIYFAIIQKWGFFDVFLSIWVQTVIIGFFNLIRLRKYKKDSPNEFKRSNKTSDDVTNTFLLLPTVYLIFIFVVYILTMVVNDGVSASINFNSIIISTISFFIYNLFAFFYNKPDELTHKYFSDEVYLSSRRIIPMHLAVIASFVSIIFTGTSFFKSGGLLLSILFLRALIDVAMHINVHKNDLNNLLNVDAVKTGKDGIYGYNFNKVSMAILKIIIAGFLLYILLRILRIF